MTRAFLDSFEPTSGSPDVGATVDLTVADIEETGIRKALQATVRHTTHDPFWMAVETDGRGERRSSSKSRLNRCGKRKSGFPGCSGVSWFAPVSGGRSISRYSRISDVEVLIREIAAGLSRDWRNLNSVRKEHTQDCLDVGGTTPTRPESRRFRHQWPARPHPHGHRGCWTFSPSVEPVVHAGSTLQLVRQ